MRPSPPATGLITLAAVLLAACTTTASPPMSDTNDPQQTSCNAEAAKPRALGKVATPDVVERARKDAGARTTRVIRPGEMVTMDYLEDRLNVDLDDADVIVNLRCG